MSKAVIAASITGLLGLGLVGCGGGMSNLSPAQSPQAVTRATSSPLAAVSNPIPVLTSASPNTTTAGSAKTTITLTGSDFVAKSEVFWNTKSLTAKYVSATSLTAVIPATDLTVAGDYNLTVKNPTPGGGKSGAITFAVTNPTPVLSSLGTPSAVAGSSKLTVTAKGSDFVKGSQVEWNGASLTTTFKSSTQLSFVVPASDLATPGTASVTVVNAAPGGGTSAAQTFTISVPVASGSFAGIFTDTAGAFGTTQFTVSKAGVISGTVTDTVGTDSGKSASIKGTLTASGAMTITEKSSTATGTYTFDSTTHVIAATLTASSGAVIHIVAPPTGTNSPFAGTFTGTYSNGTGTGSVKLTIGKLGTASGSAVDGVGKITKLDGVFMYSGHTVIYATNSAGSAVSTGTSTWSGSTLTVVVTDTLGYTTTFTLTK